ncbi:MAG: deoxyribose-phosphate aldolase [Bryobacterales bacterium]|nr:deoxyribose-phosphate aldolase [Bryobacteraceae bacterium]MDW8129449.1 deoxyribose-phosphate aldolase [Bryobacterales bacterium]
MAEYGYADIAGMIDHSLLQPFLSQDELERGIQVALDYGTATVCILPYYVARCAQRLAGTPVLATTTVGFPHGAHVTSVKVAEARQALADGARELDMVVNISAVKSGAWDYVRRDIAEVLAATRAAGGRLKVIFENCYLNEAQKIRLCGICGELGVDWVKTSTGYGSGGATEEDVALMRRHSPPQVQVKAAGGIRDLDTLLRMRALGATRIGATRTAAILEECRRRLGLPPIDPGTGCEGKSGGVSAAETPGTIGR